MSSLPFDNLMAVGTFLNTMGSLDLMNPEDKRVKESLLKKAIKCLEEELEKMSPAPVEAPAPAPKEKVTFSQLVKTLNEGDFLPKDSSPKILSSVTRGEARKRSSMGFNGCTFQLKNDAKVKVFPQATHGKVVPGKGKFLVKSPSGKLIGLGSFNIHQVAAGQKPNEKGQYASFVDVFDEKPILFETPDGPKPPFVPSVLEKEFAEELYPYSPGAPFTTHCLTDDGDLVRITKDMVFNLALKECQKRLEWISEGKDLADYQQFPLEATFLNEESFFNQSSSQVTEEDTDLEDVAGHVVVNSIE